MTQPAVLEAPDWDRQAMKAVREHAATGATFDAYTLTLAGVPEPRHPNRWGALFRAAATAGIIQAVDNHRSQKPSRRGGRCLGWQGSPEDRGQLF